jgi:predicted transposase YdaD
MTDKVANPHDAFFKHYLSQPAVAVDFLRQHLPVEVAALRDLTQLRLEKDSFVDEHLRGAFSDLIYSTVTEEQTPVRIALLCEHKSYPDPWVTFQVLRYQVGYWVREFDRVQAASPAEEPRRTGRPTLTPLLVLLVYHGRAEWKVPLRFAQQLSGMADPTTPLAQVLARYVPDFEPHFINVSTLDDNAIQGEVVTRLFVLVLKHIFDHSLGGRLDEILRLASEVIRQPSGMEMVMTLLRYIGRSAVKLDKAEMAQKLLAYLPKEGGALMETMAQEWIDEGFAKGIEQGLAKGKQEGLALGKQEGKQEGIAEGKLAAQRQTLLRLIQWRFAPSEAEYTYYAAQLDQIANLDHLGQLVDHVLAIPTEAEFAHTFQGYLPETDVPQ